MSASTDPATPLDVEACVRLANREAAGCEYAAQHNREQAKRPLDIDPEYAARARRLADESAAEAATWRALASELLGIGKDRERLREIELLTPDIAQLLDGWHADGTAWSEWDESVRRRLADWHLKSAARSALPGMGKDSEHLQEIATTGLAWLEDLRPVLHVGGTYGNAMCDEFTSPTDLHVKALLRFSAYLEETSADG